MKKIFILLVSSLLILSSCKENVKAQENNTSLSDKITFIDGEEMEAKYFMDSCIKGFGSIKSKDYCNCYMRDLARNVTYKEFESNIMMALNFGDNKYQQALNLVQNKYILKSMEKCIAIYPEALDLPYYDKEKSNEEIEALAQNHLIEIKNELGTEEYNELMKLVNLDNYSKCIMKKLFTEFEVKEMNKPTIEQQIRVEELKEICLTNNLRESYKNSDNLKETHKNTDKFVLDELIEIIKTNDIALFDEIFPSVYNKQDNFIEIRGKTIKVVHRLTELNLFGGRASNVSFYYLGNEIIMFEVAPSDLTFSKNKFENSIEKKLLYSFEVQQEIMLIHNEYFLYKDIVINTWRPTKEYEFKDIGDYDDFKYTTDNIFFLTITKKEAFEEMIEPMLKNIN